VPQFPRWLPELGIIGQFARFKDVWLIKQFFEMIKIRLRIFLAFRMIDIIC
jgi:hypothetical protein